MTHLLRIPKNFKHFLFLVGEVVSSKFLGIENLAYWKLIFSEILMVTSYFRTHLSKSSLTFNGIQKETVEVNEYNYYIARYTGFLPSEVLLSLWVYYPAEISHMVSIKTNLRITFILCLPWHREYLIVRFNFLIHLSLYVFFTI